ncbi:MAG: hypothetical protein U0944_00205, partial [Candidatus Moranbacteria bacterium]|nr:hypothetical protein [Candidatus Moranbacteria bacterium]
MQKIKEKKIRMRPASLFLAQKLGLESVLALSILASAFLLSTFLYFLKKTGVMKFMAFGWPGLKIILLTLPYDYIILFIITIVLANFIIHKFDLSRGICMDSNITVLALLAVTLLLGSFFAVAGAEDVMGGWFKKTIPGDIAVAGKVIGSYGSQVVIRDCDGTIRTLNFEDIKDSSQSPLNRKYEENEIIWAIGK